MIDYWFPIGIYRAQYPKNDEVKTVIQDYIPNQTSPMDNNIGWTFWRKMHLNNPINLTELPNTEIVQLCNWIQNETNSYAKHFNSSEDYTVNDAWLNVYHKNDFQEPHFHPGYDFSAVYYVQIPENSGSLVFENPLLGYEMRPIKTKIETTLNQTSVFYRPIEGQLLIFRSNLRHGVLPHANEIPRISIACNLRSV